MKSQVTRMDSLRATLGAMACVGLLLAAEPAWGDPPPGYYDTVDDTSSATLRSTLHPVIDDHTRFPYTSGNTDTWDILEMAQEDPNNVNNILDIYRNSSFAKQGGGNSFYNREHSWPTSYGFPSDVTSNYPYTDCHHLFLSDDGYNSSRSNKPYRYCNAGCSENPTDFNNGQGGGSGTYPGNSNWTTGSNTTGIWETWIDRRGDVARAMFYMDIRYEGGQHNITLHNEPDLILTDSEALIASGNTGSNEAVAYMGMLSDLLQWHIEDPVDAWEMDQNDLIESFQGNRNPFVDHPEWVECLFDDVCGGGGGCTIDPDCDDGLFCNGAETCSAGTCLSGSDPCPGQGCDEVADACVPPPTAGDPWINEFHYDNASSDTGEFVEIAGPAGVDLSGWSVVGYNGNGGGTYKTVNLSGVIPDQGGCMGTLDFTFTSMQNGSPDGLALVDDIGTVLEFISYEGSFTATNGPANGMTSVDIVVFEPTNSPVGESLQLSGSGAVAADFVWQSPAAETPGLPNNGQTLDGCGGGCSTNGDCDDGVFCNGAEVCNAGTCEAGTPINCDDGVGCTDDSCNETTDSCDNVANNATCDDGLFCNGSETCDAVLDCQAGASVDCNDAVGCTSDSCNEGTDSCDNVAIDANCADGLFCNGDETCDPLLDCQAGSAVNCDDGVGCTDDSCNETTDSCDNAANNANCDDGLFCNGAETCNATLDCQAGTDPCPGQLCDEPTDTCIDCTIDADCDDGVFCNGAEMCAAGSCQAGTAVNCDDGVGCTDDSCNETTDSCGNVANDGNCDDSLFCNGSETCDALLDCQAGSAVDCDDGVACTDDSCNETTDSCDNVANNGNCTDGLFCNGTETCDALLDCQAGTAVDCNDGVGCTDDACNEATDSCDNMANNGNCDDGLFCNGAETCSATLDCQAGGDPCPGQGCDEVADSCVTPAGDPWINEFHYDNDSSDVGEFVEIAGPAGLDLNGWSVVGYNGNGGGTYSTVNLSGVIPDQGGCLGTLDFTFTGMQNGSPDGLALIDDLGGVVEFISYEGAFTATNGPASGLTSVDIGVSEPTNSPIGESLQLSGTGSGAAAFTWQGPAAETPGQPNNGQTFDGCNPECAIDADCDDGVFCNGAETCSGGSCQAGTSVNCDDGVGCTDDACNEVTDSCDNVANNGNCDDGLFCNGSETCDAGLDCQAGTTVNCDDGVGCTDDACNEATNSCDNVTNDGNCNDGLFCNGSETCDAGLDCQAGSTVNCDDGVGCTDDTCNESTDSCDNTANDDNCDNGVFCDGAETCNATLDCQAGSDPCPGQFCDEPTGTCIDCTIDADCDDGAFCNGAETCVAGSCQAGTAVNCDDGVGCTDDACNETTDSCNNSANDGNCDDSLYCNGSETCDALLDCQAGTTVDCDDGVGCTDDACNETTDSCDNSANDANCADGLFCNGDETCDPLLDCQAGNDPCGGNPCDEVNDVCEGSTEIWMSFRSNTSVPGVGTVADEDIVSYDVDNDTWSLIFDGSDVGLSSLEISALAVDSNGDILMSFTDAGSVSGLQGGPSGDSIDDSDIVRFTPTTLGSNTSGSFTFHFDGSDVAMTSNGEDIDGLAIATDGRLIISSTGGFSGSGASGADEDLFIFTDSSLGSNTAGSFALHFDGSDVGQGGVGGEDIDAVGLTASGTILLSTVGTVNVPGVTAEDEDILEFIPTMLGSSTSGMHTFYLDLTALGINSNEDVGSLFVFD